MPQAKFMDLTGVTYGRLTALGVRKKHLARLRGPFGSANARAETNTLYLPATLNKTPDAADRALWGALMGQPQPDSRPKMLASFKIPLGRSEAELIFTGERLDSADFDALIEYVELFKKQYDRKKAAQEGLNEILRAGPSPESPA